MEFAAHDRAIYLPSSETLVCADFHVGRDTNSNVDVALGGHDDITSRFEMLLEKHEPTEAVIAGDLLHSFDRIPTGAARTVRTIEQLADDAGCHVVITPGNHDTMLKELWDGSIVQEYPLGDGSIVVTHGHVIPETEAAWYIIGHDHPTIEIEGARHPCYLHAPKQYDCAGVMMLPTFSRVPPGVVVNEMTANEFLSPLITDVSSIRPIVSDPDSDETYEFPRLGSLRQFL